MRHHCDEKCIAFTKETDRKSYWKNSLEKERLGKFNEKHKLLSDSKYGFRSNRSTSLALIELIEEITNCIDK